MSENKIVKGFAVGGENYDIWAKQTDASGIQGGNNNQIPWNTVSSLTGTISTATTTGFATPWSVAEAIENQIGGVYKVKGSESWSNLTATSAKKNGNVYNLTAVTDDAVDANGQKLYVGDNVVYVTGTNAGWDKLGGITTGMASQLWVTDTINSSTSAQTTALWNNITTYINNELGSANSASKASALWTDINSLVNDKTSAIDNSLSTSAQMTVASNNSNLVQNGAITSYVENKNSSKLNKTDIYYDTSTKNLIINN